MNCILPGSVLLYVNILRNVEFNKCKTEISTEKIAVTKAVTRHEKFLLGITRTENSWLKWWRRSPL